MLGGLGVPSLRSLWGAVRNQQLYILRMYCKGCISFNFSFFFKICTTYRKRKITLPYRKNKKIQFFFVIHTTYSKKKYTHLQQKKITRLDGFFVHDLHFSLYSIATGDVPHFTNARACVCIPCDWRISMGLSKHVHPFTPHFPAPCPCFFCKGGGYFWCCCLRKGRGW